MAGGEGTRLRPLTCDLPKPMARLCGRPVIEYILDLLKKNGVDEASITLKYLPQAIKNNFPDGEYEGIRLNFSVEDEPLGTAGGVKNAASGISEDFVVISGDALCDLDLSAAMRFHREKGAAATLVLARVPDPREYGLVVTAANGAVKGFVEKPGWAQAVTDAVNTGIYILNPSCLKLIPDGKPFDFAKDLFPRMLKNGEPVFGYNADGYWCDIGDIGAYTSSQFDMLDRRVDCSFTGFSQNGVYFKSRMPSGNFTVIPPVYFGDSVKIGDYSVIGPFAVIDDFCTVGMGAKIKNSVLLPYVFAGDHCELRGALACAGASLARRAAMFDGAVAGTGSVIGADASVSPGVRIWPGGRLSDGARASVNLKAGILRRGLFDDAGITGEVGADMTPEKCAAIGAASAGMCERAAVACCGGAAAANLKNAVMSGAVSTGAQIYDFGISFESQFEYAVRLFGLDQGIFVRQAGPKSVIKLCGPDGMTVGRETERKLDTAVTGGVLRRCAAKDCLDTAMFSGIAVLYQRELLRLAPDGLDGIHATGCSANRNVRAALKSALAESGCADGGIRVHVNATGRFACFFDENGNYISPRQSLAIGCQAVFESGGDVAVPYDAPRIIDTLAERYGRRVLRYYDCPTSGSDTEARKLAARQPFARDGLQNAVSILTFIKAKKTTLAKLADSLPKFAVSVKSMRVEGNPGRILRAYESNGESGQPAEGVLLEYGGGKVLLRPLKRGGGVKIIAEAADMETAGELCDLFESRLKQTGVDNSRK